MEERILVILPTKERLNDFIIFSESWVKTTEGKSDVVVVINEDDKTYENIKSEYNFIYEYVSKKPFLHILNEIAVKYSESYRYIMFMEDDCNYVTNGWESIFINKLNELGDNGIVWGNDLLNKDKLVGLPVLNSNIIRKLGYMSPPELMCLCVDNFWLALGNKLNSLYYFDDVIVEHRHYSTNKRNKDSVSVEVDLSLHPDLYSYNSLYLPNRFSDDIKKLTI